MKCEVTECGYTRDGLCVSAITDSAGSQVVVKDNQSLDGTHLLSKPLANHGAAIALGKDVVKYGINIYNEWGSPLELFEIACIGAIAV